MDARKSAAAARRLHSGNDEEILNLLSAMGKRGGPGVVGAEKRTREDDDTDDNNDRNIASNGELKGTSTLMSDIQPIIIDEPYDDAAGGDKPLPGSEHWNKVRRDNHKEVERKRREIINDSINSLARIVPCQEKNKGSILQHAVQYIQQLKDKEAANIEKWTLEKLLTDQAISELTRHNEVLKADAERWRAEADVWRKAAEGGGGGSKDDKERSRRR